ncbi:BMP family lipoprotein [Bacillus mesophilum]|uniref:BMP family lipoprotein n=1 Tax=Bacillus mesophilum TaxID=1071718 RepID=UPI003B845AE6
MNLKKITIAIMIIAIFLAGCSRQSTTEQAEKEYKIGIMLSDAGLGDESFNDSAFQGLEQARDELGVLFDYKEAADGNYEEKITELVKEKYDLIIGLGFSVKDALESVAKQYPEQQFLLIDEQSELENIISLTFKEQEGSFLVGMVAAMASKTGKIGFVGGVDTPLIHHFEMGYIDGAKHYNPEIEIVTEYVGSFDDAEAGSAIAADFIKNDVDFLYHAAGFSGFGMIKKAEEAGVFAAGVDSDQFFIAEKTVVTSMLKNVNTAVFQIAQTLQEEGSISEKSYLFGLSEEGVGLAPIRNITLTAEQQAAIEKAQEEIVSGKITVTSEKENSQ